LAKIYAGGTPSKDKEEYWVDGEIPWINSGAVNQGLITESSAYISQSGYENSSAKWVPKGALVMALAGQGKTKGMVAQMGIDSTCNQSMSAIVPSGIDARYLLYWLSANYKLIRSTASDDLRDGLNLQMLGDIPCPIPSTRLDQTRIANFLDEKTARIDALIAEKERLVEALEELRSSTISEAVLVNAKGWSQTRLKFLVRDIIDTEHKTVAFYDDGEYLVARTTNIKNGRLTLDGAKYTDAAGYEDWTRRAVPSTGDILFTREAPAGEACLVPEGLPLCLGQRTVLIRLDQNKADASFVLWSLYGGLAARFISDLSQGSTVAHFNMPDIGNIPLFTGPIREQRARAMLLESKLKQVDSLKLHVAEHINRLREYRSSLISAAVTGQLNIDDFQARQLEAA
jgi:type I restriction enzyme S subunit